MKPIKSNNTTKTPATKQDIEDVFGPFEPNDSSWQPGIPTIIKKSLSYTEFETIANYINIANRKNSGIFTFAIGYYYRMTTPEKFAEQTLKFLTQNGLTGELITVGDHPYHGFDGSAPLISAKSSFFYAIIKVTK